jgi:hypothetical protein
VITVKNGGKTGQGVHSGGHEKGTVAASQ